MDRLARNVDDLRRIVRSLTGRGIRVEFAKEGLTFTGEDAPMATLLLSVMGAFAEFERALIRARQRGAYRGRNKALSAVQRGKINRLTPVNLTFHGRAEPALLRQRFLCPA